MSDLRATNFKGRTSGSVPNMPDGVVVGSAVTISSSGIDVGAAGIITATTFSGTVSSSTGSFSGDVDIADKIVHTGDTNTAIRFPAADTFTVETAGSERLRILANGLIGIGTDNPDAFNPNADDLVIFGTGHQGLTIRSGTAHDGSIMFNDTNDANQRGIIRYIHTDDAMAFHTSGGEALRIATDGNVSIGGTEGITYSLLDGLAINTDNGDAGIIVNSSSSAHNAYISFGYGDSGTVSHADQFSAYIGRIGDDTLALGTQNSLRVYVTSTGRVGINSEGTTAYLTIRDSEDGGDGNNGSGVLRFSRRNGSATNDAILYAVHDGSDGVRALKFDVSNSERLRVSAAGVNITGIATATSLFEGTTRVATTGKAIAMAMLFG